jgi:cell division ATPase FtsA
MSLRSPVTPPQKNLEDITEKLMEKILDMVNQNVQDALNKFQDTKNNVRRHGNK